MAVGTGNRGKGRKKGVPNKATGALKDMILQALKNVGGVSYLMEQAQKDNAAPFLALVGKVLPLQVTGEGGGPVLIVTGVDRDDKGS